MVGLENKPSSLIGLLCDEIVDGVDRSEPTLRFKNTSININALTMISKRLERDESIDVSRLLQKNREALSQAERRFR